MSSVVVRVSADEPVSCRRHRWTSDDGGAFDVVFAMLGTAELTLDAEQAERLRDALTTALDEPDDRSGP